MTAARHHFHRLTTLVVGGAVWAAVVQGQDAPLAGPQRDLAEAVTLYQDGKYAEALAAIQKFQTTHKFSALLAEAIYYEGWCFWAQQKYAEALASFERLARMYPTAPLATEAVLRQAECQRAMEKLPEALKLYREFIAENPQHDLLPQALLGEATTLRLQKDYNGAKATLQKLLTEFEQDTPVRLDALFLLGQILNEQKDYAGAQAVFKQIAAQRTNPRATEGLFLAAETMFDSQRFADAVEYYRRVQSKPAILAGIANEIAALEARRGEFFRQNAVTVYQTRMETLRRLQQKFADAADLHPAALFRIANCYLSLGKPEEASVVYRQFLRLYPTDRLAEQAQFGLIQALTERRQLVEAEQEKKAFEAKYAGSKLLTAAEFMQAESLLGRQEYERAIASYQKYITTSKDEELIQTAKFRIATCFFGLKEFERARDALNEFLRQYPQSKLVPDALFRLGRTHYELSQRAAQAEQEEPTKLNLTKAAEVFEQLRANHPQAANLPEATFQLGYIYSLLGVFEPANYDKAIAAFSDFAKRWPEYTGADGQSLVPESLFQIGRCHVARNRYDQAVAAYQKIVDDHPQATLAPFAGFEIANVYATAQQPAKMIEAFRRYIEEFPDHVKVGDALYAIGSTYENQQQADEALAAYRQLVTQAMAVGDRLPDEFRNAAVAGQIRIAAILEEREKFEEAVAGCEEFLTKFAHEPVVVRTMINQIAQIYRKARRTHQAYARLAEIAARLQQIAAVRHAAATAEIELALGERDYARANPAVQRLLVDPNRDQLPAGSLAALGNAFLKTDRAAQALEIFQQMRTRFSGDPRSVALATVGIGQAYLGLGQYDEAAKEFQQVLAQPDVPGMVLPEAELGLGKVYLAQAAGRSVQDPTNVKAVELLTRVLASSRGELAGEASFHLGQFFFAQSGDPQKGKENCKTALAYFLRVALLTGGAMGEEAAFRSAQCHECLGNVEAARGAYNAYLRRFATGAFAQEARAKLAALPPPKS